VKEFAAENIRNIGLFGHGGVGKTSLAEAIVYSAGMTNRMGKTDDGTTVSDYTEEEIQRQLSISAALLHAEWKQRKINIIDTPGYADFVGEVCGALRVVDLAVILLAAPSGIEVGTVQVRDMVNAQNLPRAFFVNKMDKEHASYQKCLDQLKENFTDRAIPVFWPIGEGSDFSGIVDLVKMKGFKFDAKGKASETEIPAGIKDAVDFAANKLMEAAAEADDTLLEKFFDAGKLSEDEIKLGLRQGIIDGKIFPVFAGSSTQNIGITSFMDFAGDYFPSPLNRSVVIAKKPDSDETVECPPSEAAPVTAFVFKTVSEPHVGELSFFRVFSGKLTTGMELFNSSRGEAERITQMFVMNGKNRGEIGMLGTGDIGGVVKLKNTHTGDTICEKKSPLVFDAIAFPDPIFEMAVRAKAKGDEEKVVTGLARQHEEDPTFSHKVFADLRQTILYGQGEMHFDVAVSKLKKRFGVEVEFEKPRIPYRETIVGKAEVQAKYKKQTGGRGQYGDVYIRLKPRKRGDGFEFINAIVGGVIPSKFIPSVEKGIVESMVEGALSGNPVVDVSVELYYGSYHNVDSSDMAFKVAGSMAFKDAFMKSNPILLEPVYQVEVKVPDDYTGDVMGDLSSKRGKIQGMEPQGKWQVIKAHVPLAELYKYSVTLRSITQGRGLHKQKFSHYEEVPREISAKVIEEAKKQKADAES